ncbi:gamma-glutamylcyclotransferase family protein [Pseudohalioglobus lutimaris]|jgi:hypothetical protein|uniref:Gamma-glutamylcyclotransferase n=1 Tax=Pseudohalioglobus lutimaris TaxID=1737061 RepID=A0A2N5WZW2_9GAMM|nr:gamma-glutamylcyclotransferase family protein [Pseudohalioglobus lutimaris]PLW67783.1 hypothetical protein C0039_15305 [Pseudohalioglobus lutimaris]
MFDRSWLKWLVGLCIGVPASFVLGVNLYIQLPPQSPEPHLESVVGYFAYGSNMNDRYFTRVRGIVRSSSEMASLPDYEVAFNLNGIPSIEPSFANLAPAKGGRAYGVFHRLPAGELERVLGSEGDSYNVRTVTVYLKDGSTAIAKTLISDPSLELPVTPSKRYLGYMHEAALAYDMPPEIIARYNPDQGAYIPVVSELFGAAMHTGVWVFARL